MNGGEPVPLLYNNDCQSVNSGSQTLNRGEKQKPRVITPGLLALNQVDTRPAKQLNGGPLTNRCQEFFGE
jgi:hypothetical protein